MTTPLDTSSLSGGEALGTALRRPTVVIQPVRSLFDLDLASVYRSWELIYFLTWRDVKVRYKQTAIGIGWAVLQPLLTMVIFTAVFSGLAKIPSDGVPYPVFAFAALLPWTYFTQAVGRSGTSLVNNAGLLTKVYFPRLVIPLSGVLSPLVDFVVAFGLLAALMAWYRIVPGSAIFMLPLFLLLCVTTALAVSLWLSALCVKYRDVVVVIPFLLQIWLYASPVVYPASVIPEKWRLLYSLNPMAGVIEGVRWSLLGTASPDFNVMAVSALVVLILLFSGLLYFKHTEQTFADIV